MTNKPLTQDQLAKVDNILKRYMADKTSWVKRYGKDAESVMRGRAINTVKKETESMNKEKLKELVRKSLMEDEKQFSEEEIEMAMRNLNMTREEAIKHLQQAYADYKQFDMDESKESSVSEDIEIGHTDNEPHMIKGDLYQIGKYAMELYAILEELEENGGEYDFPAWWQSKITIAKENMDSAKHYLEFEMNEPKIDAMVDKATGEEPHEGEPMPPMMNEVEVGDMVKIKKEYGGGKGKVEDKRGSFVIVNGESYHESDVEVIKGNKLHEDEITKTDKLAAKIAKALKSHTSNEDQNNLKQARKALNKGDEKAAEKIAKPYLEEKHLTPAEKKKKEEIVKAMKKDFKGPKPALYAIATKKAEKVAEDVAKKLKEGLPKGYWDKHMKAKDETNESYETLKNKIEKQGKSAKAAGAIAGAVAAYKAKGGGKGPTAKQSK